MKLCVGSQVVPLEMHKVLVDMEGQTHSMEKPFIIISDVKKLTWLERALNLKWQSLAPTWPLRDEFLHAVSEHFGKRKRQWKRVDQQRKAVPKNMLLYLTVRGVEYGVHAPRKDAIYIEGTQENLKKFVEETVADLKRTAPPDDADPSAAPPGDVPPGGELDGEEQESSEEEAPGDTSPAPQESEDAKSEAADQGSSERALGAPQHRERTSDRDERIAEAVRASVSAIREADPENVRVRWQPSRATFFVQYKGTSKEFRAPSFKKACKESNEETSLMEGRDDALLWIETLK